MQYGIPNFRLEKNLVEKEIDSILNENIKVEYNTVLAKQISSESSFNQITIDELHKRGYEYIFISIGNEVSNSMQIPAIESKFVLNANDFLRNNHDECKRKDFVVIGGGNVAIDSSRKAKKLGGNSTIIYRKTDKEMPANKSEYNEALSEGVDFIFRSIVKEIKEVHTQDDITHNLILRVENCSTKEESEFETDYLVQAIGSKLNNDYIDERILKDENGRIKVDENYETSFKNIFAGGDLVNEKLTVAYAIKTGRDVAEHIANTINKK